MSKDIDQLITYAETRRIKKEYSNYTLKQCTKSIYKNLPIIKDFEDKEENKIGEIKDEI